MQELLLALWRAVPAFVGASKPATFIFRVAHNAALTWRRGAATYRAYVERFEADTQPTAASAPTWPAHEAEALSLLYAEIRRLPPMDRSLILLQLDGVSYAEIAQIHGLSETHVGVRLTRIRQKLVDALKEVTHDPR